MSRNSTRTDVAPVQVIIEPEGKLFADLSVLVLVAGVESICSRAQLHERHSSSSNV